MPRHSLRLTRDQQRSVRPDFALSPARLVSPEPTNKEAIAQDLPKIDLDQSSSSNREAAPSPVTIDTDSTGEADVDLNKTLTSNDSESSLSTEASFGSANTQISTHISQTQTLSDDMGKTDQENTSTQTTAEPKYIEPTGQTAEDAKHMAALIRTGKNVLTRALTEAKSLEEVAKAVTTRDHLFTVSFYDRLGVIKGKIEEHRDNITDLFDKLSSLDSINADFYAIKAASECARAEPYIKEMDKMLSEIEFELRKKNVEIPRKRNPFETLTSGPEDYSDHEQESSKSLHSSSKRKSKESKDYKTRAKASVAVKFGTLEPESSTPTSSNSKIKGEKSKRDNRNNPLLPPYGNSFDYSGGASASGGGPPDDDDGGDSDDERRRNDPRRRPPFGDDPNPFGAGGNADGARRRDNRDGRDKPRKPNEALRPGKLTIDSTPVELRIWMEQYHAYYTSSQMDLCTLNEQQMYFKACLDMALIAKLAGRIHANTPVIPIYNRNQPQRPNRAHDSDSESSDEEEDLSCFELLAEEFILAYPILNRRVDFFMAHQGQNQSFTDWVKQLHKLGDECELHLLDADDIYTLRYLTGIRNVQLKEKLYSMKNPSPKRLFKKAISWEVSQRSMKGVSTTGTAKANNAQSKKKNKQPNPQANAVQAVAQKFGAPSQRPSPPQANYRCYRCGSTNSAHTCRGINAICDICQKKGHFKAVCQSKTRGQAANSGNNKSKVGTSKSQQKRASAQSADAAAQ